MGTLGLQQQLPLVQILGPEVVLLGGMTVNQWILVMFYLSFSHLFSFASMLDVVPKRLGPFVVMAWSTGRMVQRRLAFRTFRRFSTSFMVQ